MGAVPGDDDASEDQKPRRGVKITKAFWLRLTPVAVAAYRKFGEATGRSMPPGQDFNHRWSGTLLLSR